jgi:chaperonin cofactor prefoldin
MMNDEERDEVLIRIDERTERIEDRINRHEQRIETNESEIDNLKSDTQKNTSDIKVAKTLLGALGAMFTAISARVMGLLNI